MTTPTVTLYTKPGCHLCEAAEQVIVAVRAARAFELRVVNVLDAASADGRYRHDVPVVFVGDVEVARHRVTEEALRAALARADESP